MSAQKIIRHVSNMDCGHVTTQAVLEVVTGLEGDFTTFEVAERMGVDEYPVRAAMSWLLARDKVRKVGQRKRFTLRTHDVYWATTYEVVIHGEPADFAALMGAFCKGAYRAS